MLAVFVSGIQCVPPYQRSLTLLVSIKQKTHRHYFHRRSVILCFPESVSFPPPTQNVEHKGCHVLPCEPCLPYTLSPEGDNWKAAHDLTLQSTLLASIEKLEAHVAPGRRALARSAAAMIRRMTQLQDENGNVHLDNLERILKAVGQSVI